MVKKTTKTTKKSAPKKQVKRQPKKQTVRTVYVREKSGSDIDNMTGSITKLAIAGATTGMILGIGGAMANSFRN